MMGAAITDLNGSINTAEKENGGAFTQVAKCSEDLDYLMTEDDNKIKKNDREDGRIIVAAVGVTTINFASC